MRQPALAPHVGRELFPGDACQSDADILDVFRRELCPLDRVGDGVAAEVRAMRHVEGTPPALGEAGARGRDNNGIGHGRTLPRALIRAYWLNVLPSAARRASSGAGVQKSLSAPGTAANSRSRRATLYNPSMSA